MKKLLSLLLISISVITKTTACTACGCSASNQYLGILPQSKSNFAGIQYQFRAFTSTHHPEAGEITGSTSYERYNTTQIWGRYHITPRLQIFGFLPLVMNTRIENNVITTNSGLGDATILINYKVLGATCNGKKWQHTLLAGAGIKLPTGKYDKQSIQYGEGLPNMQPGTASFDFIVNANYTAQLRKSGLNTDVSFVLTTQNTNQYKFGNRLQAAVLGFYTINADKFKIIPQLGARYEYAFSDYDNYALSIRNDMSGGSQLYASVGIQTFYKGLGIQAMAHKPIAQHYAGGMVNSKLKIETGIYLLF